ncbi:hypothetical protein EFK50_06405 [Nocardioides marmoriginsengisoli]|uniref:Uncharacterized protein n=1 Tax=Nocardioides marmoriginsengisoli TaxID=661483 RepID=A0A3N0CLK1_9ACTN|nr:hypothetical protein [Nocardioides marmoriginsengisoli]RNL64161.1 hypothetical protein EFK50_06405 [Nocardioides marmoriginsengisoli]
MKRTLIVTALVLALLPPVAVETATAAPTATPGVSIGTIPTRTAPYGKTARVTVPRVTTRGKVLVTSKRFTIKKNGRVVRRNATSAALRPGKYSVTTTAKYRAYRNVVTREVRNGDVLRAKAGTKVNASCVIDGLSDPFDESTPFLVNLDCQSADQVTDHFYLPTTVTDLGDQNYQVHDAWDGSTYQTVFAMDRSQLVGEQVSLPAAVPDDLYGPGQIVVNTTRKVAYGKTRSASRTQKLLIRQGAKPRTCATLAEFQSVRYDFDEPEAYGDSMATVAKKLHNAGKQSSYTVFDDQVIEFREYKACSAGAFMSVGFVNGYAYAKNYFG